MKRLSDLFRPKQARRQREEDERRAEAERVAAENAAKEAAEAERIEAERIVAEREAKAKRIALAKQNAKKRIKNEKKRKGAIQRAKQLEQLTQDEYEAESGLSRLMEMSKSFTERAEAAMKERQAVETRLNATRNEEERKEAERVAAREAAEAATPRSTKENTLIVFDWDDTIFPASEYGGKQRSYWDVSDVSEVFDPVANAAIALLTESCRLGVVKIVTQATKRWCVQAMRLFMPELLTTIDKFKIEVITARDAAASDLLGRAVNYKDHIFRSLVEPMIRKAGVDPDTNMPLPVTVMSIGDGEREIRAARNLADVLPKKYIKIIKMEDAPTALRIAQQLNALSVNIDKLLDTKTHIFFNFAAPAEEEIKEVEKKTTTIPFIE